MVSEDHLELPQGTLDLLILKTLALGPQHGWAIVTRLHQISSEAVLVKQGSLYPALHRLERRGLIDAEWGVSDNNRRAKRSHILRGAAGTTGPAVESATGQIDFLVIDRADPPMPD